MKLILIGCMMSGKGKIVTMLALAITTSNNFSNDDDKIPEDELPYGHPERPYKKELNFNNINLKDPEALKKVANFNKNILLFVTVNGNPTR